MSRRKSRRKVAPQPLAFAEPARKNLPAGAKTLIASVANDITIPYFTGVLQHADDTLIQQGGGKGLAIYDEIKRDSHASAMLQKRIGTVISRDWEVAPGGDRPIDKEAADLVDACLEALPFDKVCENLLDATLKGFAVAEVVWDRVGSQIRPVGIRDIDQRRFAFGRDWRPRLLTLSQMLEGEELPDRKFIVHRVGVKGNNPYGLGLGNKLFWAVLFKREGITFWLHFLEKFAGPTVLGKTPYGTLTDEQNRLLNTLMSIRTSSAVTVPIGTEVEFLEASRGGTVSYQEFVEYWDRQISICVTGETLTTQVSAAGGNRALGEVHQEQLDIIGDRDGDGLTDTLRDSLVRWIVEYNLPGAAIPSVRRIRPKNKKAEAETSKAEADATEATDRAIRAVVRAPATFEDDQVAREYIVSFPVAGRLSDKTVDALVAARHVFAGAAEIEADAFRPGPTDPRFSAGGLKKKTLTHCPVCGCQPTTTFAERFGPVARITDQLVAAAERHFTRRIGAIRRVVTSAEVFEDIPRGLLELAAAWTPDAFGALLGQAMELARYEGREAVFLDAEEPAAFAEPQLERQEFREQIDFLTQKRPKPTRAWTDAMRGDHDRAFVVAGATDMAMLEEFHAAVIEAAKTYDTADFAKDFDRIVEKYGWSYNGGREWRIRTIVETNIRTSYMAGRLKQMRDPDMVKLRPYWQYLHADTRVPLNPRAQHVAWDGMILRWDDPWWDVYFPPNDWLCSCGVRTLSRGDLRRLGKDGPDTAPEIIRRRHTDKTTGETVSLPDGVGYGWDYMPGDHWERGLVPSALMGSATGTPAGARHLVSIDQPEPITDLIAKALPFKSTVLPQNLPDEEYLRAFLEPFGAEPGRAVLYQDKAGHRLPISDQLFRDRWGDWKLLKGGRALHSAMLAEAIMDPDEIWLGVRAVELPDFGYSDHVMTRRYIRVDPDTGLFVAFDLGRKFWEGVTGFQPSRNFQRQGGVKPTNWAYLDRERVGKLLWKRK